MSDKYFDIHFTHNQKSFYIEECSFKPKTHNSALSLLKDIETITKNNLKYDFSRKDGLYSSKRQDEILHILKEKSSQLHEGYKTKESKLFWIIRKIFGKEKEIESIHTRIEQYANNYIRRYTEPPEVLPLPNELIQKITEYLGISDLGTLGQLNFHGQAHSSTNFIEKAQKFGYNGEDPSQASKYLNNLFKDIDKLTEQGVIPEKYISYKAVKHTLFREHKKPDAEKTLQNLLNNLSTEDLLSILSNEKLYSPSISNFRRMFLPHGNWKVTDIANDPMKQQRSLALALAAANGDGGIAGLLLQHGADPNLPDANGCFPLHLAARAGDPEIVKLLLEHKAQPNEKTPNQETPLSFACDRKNLKNKPCNPEVVKLLIQYGADPNSGDVNGRFPLHLAAKTGESEVIKLLLKHKANPNETDPKWGTPLNIICKYSHCHPEALKLLLEHGADPNIGDANGRFPLHLATKAGDAKVIKLLLKHKAKPNETDPKWGTPLHIVCKHSHRHPEIVELLLEHGADPNIEDVNGRFPLHLAVKAGDTEVTKLLLEHQAKPNGIVPKWGTPLHVVCKHPHHYPSSGRILELLLQNGANPNIPDTNGILPLERAKVHKHEDVITILQKY